MQKIQPGFNPATWCVGAGIAACLVQCNGLPPVQCIGPDWLEHAVPVQWHEHAMPVPIVPVPVLPTQDAGGDGWQHVHHLRGRWARLPRYVCCEPCAMLCHAVPCGGMLLEELLRLLMGCPQQAMAATLITVCTRQAAHCALC